MLGGKLIVVDWTAREAQVVILAERSLGFELQSEFSMSTRCAIRHEHPDTLCNLFGTDALDIQQDERTIVFEQLGRDLPRIEDADLQIELLKGFWRALHMSLVQREILSEGQTVPVYVIPPVRLPPTLLERFRVGCVRETPLCLVGFTNAAVALILGFLRSEEVSSEWIQIVRSQQATVCLVVASDESTVDVACFDYAFAAPRQHRILIRDHFQTTCGGLLSRLRDCDWLGSFSQLVVIEDPTLPQSAQSALTVPLQAISDAVKPYRQKVTNASQLSVRGASHLALCASGRASDDQEYDIGHSCHIGIQIDQQYFEPVIAKKSWKNVTEFPHLAAQTFRLRGRPGDALRLNLFSGYSTRVADAVPLGYTILAQEELTHLSDAGAFTAVVRLDASGSGEFLLGLIPENRVVHRQPFRLQGLVG